MYIKIKNIVKVGNWENQYKIRNTCNSCNNQYAIVNKSTDTCATCTSQEYPTSVSDPNIDSQGNPIYTIAWVTFADKGDTEYIVSYIPVSIPGIPDWPKPAQISSTSNYYFGYICQNTQTAYDITSCTCPGGERPPAGDFGFCTSDTNGGTPYYPKANIEILANGYYGIQMILDTFSPACPATKDDNGTTYEYLPQMQINLYQSKNDIGSSNKALIASNYDSSLIGKKKITINGRSWAIWYPSPTSMTSLVAPIPIPNADVQGTDFQNIYPLYAGNVLEFVLKYNCKGAGNTYNTGSFSGTIRIIPQVVLQ